MPWWHKEWQSVTMILHWLCRTSLSPTQMDLHCLCQTECSKVNTLRPRQIGCHFADNIFKCIFLDENVWISIKISLNFVPKGSINNIPALAQIMAWRRPGDKPLSEPMMVSLLMNICVTRPQWIEKLRTVQFHYNMVHILDCNGEVLDVKNVKNVNSQHKLCCTLQTVIPYQSNLML